MKILKNIDVHIIRFFSIIFICKPKVCIEKQITKSDNFERIFIRIYKKNIGF
jgi:hypothetical protein